jgi:beta-N-acetylhexosaminidase
LKREIHSSLQLLLISVDITNNIKKVEVGQLIMPRLEIAKYENELSYRSFISDIIRQKKVGGFCVFGGTVENLPIILAELQSIAKDEGIPELLMSCDCEWGLPMRLHSGGTEFPHLMALEQMGDKAGITEVAEAIGIEMSALGLHWNFAPVADVNSNPNNPIINIRAFSGDAQTVADCAMYFYQGLENAGIISTAKHFPGHGDTYTDSHRDLPIINKSADEFQTIELLPFKYLAANGIPTIMTGHIAAPQLAVNLGAIGEEKNLPATISPFLTRKLLREQMGFDGVIITDSLEMYGLQKLIKDPGEIASRAIAAGADILLMPTDPIAAYNGLIQSLEKKVVSIQSVEQRIARIEKLRRKYVIEKPPQISVKWMEHQEIADRAAKNSLILSGDIKKPLAPSSVLIIASGAESEKIQRTELLHFFSSAFQGIEIFLLIANTPITQIELGNNPLIITLYRPRGALTEEFGTGTSFNSRMQEIIKRLVSASIHPEGVVSLGNPYVADDFLVTSPNFVLKTYSDSNPSVRMTLQLLEKYI